MKCSKKDSERSVENESFEMEEIVQAALGAIMLEELKKTEDFNHLEEFGVRKALELLRKTLGQVLENYDEAILAEHDSRYESKGKESRSILTTAGWVTYWRRRYKMDVGSILLLDVMLDLPPRIRISPCLSRLASDCGIDTSYQKGADFLEHYTNADISKMSVGRALEKNAELLAETESKERNPKIETPVLDVEADGCFVPLQRRSAQKEADRLRGKKRKRAYKEVRVFSAYTGKEPADSKNKKRLNVMHFATTKSSQKAWEKFSQNIDAAYDTEGIFYSNLACDGEVSYLKGAAHLPGIVVTGYDLHHIPTSLASTFGRSIAAEIYATMKSLGWEAGYDVLRAYADDFYQKSKDEKYRDIVSFINAHEEDMKTSLKYNLGTIEGTNAHIIGSRCKRFGGGWGRRLEAMVRLRAADASGIKPGLAYRDHKIDLPKIISERNLEEIENCIKAYEQKAKKNCPRVTENLPPEYYHQAPIAHRSKNEKCYSLLREWA